MTVSKWNNANSGFWSESTRASIARSVNQIRHWKVIQGDYSCIPNIKATYFVDPPYQHVKGYKFEKINYNHLGNWCRTRDGQVIVCEQARADWLPFRSFRDNTSGRTNKGGTRKKSTEVIWTN